MLPSSQRTQHLFVVRLWYETDAATAQQQWRGAVVHQATGQSHYFNKLEDLMSYIALHSGVEVAQWDSKSVG